MTGAAGEQLAVNYLKKSGFKILARNWLCKAGEIDVIARLGTTLVIVEVRVRGSKEFGSAAETVNFGKQQKIIRAAANYQQKNNYWGDIRFDVIAIELGADNRPRLEHIPYAFEATS